MGFDASKVSLGQSKVVIQQSFKPRNNTNNNRPPINPRVVFPYEIVGNDTANNGYILAVVDNLYNDGETRHLKITIDDGAYSEQKARDKAKPRPEDPNFNGAYIDTKMVKKFNIQESNKTDKKKAIGLEGAIFGGKAEKINDIEYIPVVVRRIINVPRLDKVKEGVFTASGYYDQSKETQVVTSIEHWMINPIQFDDKVNIEKLENYLDEVGELERIYKDNKANNITDRVDQKPRLGFKFIASRVTKNVDPATNEPVIEKRTIIDSSDCFEASKTEEGEYSSLSKEMLQILLQGYKQYVFEGYGEAEPSLVEKLDIPADEVVVELISFHSYRTTTMSDRFVINSGRKGIEYSPLYRMLNTPYHNSIGTDKETRGKSHAALGFILVSPDKTEENEAGDLRKVKQCLVSREFFGTIQANILSFLRHPEDDKKYEVDERIRKRVYSQEELQQIAKRKEEKELKEGGKTSGLSQGSSSLAQPPQNLGLQAAQEKTEDSMADIFSEPKEKEIAQPVEKSAPPIDDYDDDIPF